MHTKRSRVIGLENSFLVLAQNVVILVHWIVGYRVWLLSAHVCIHRLAWLIQRNTVAVGNRTYSHLYLWTESTDRKLLQSTLWHGIYLHK